MPLFPLRRVATSGREEKRFFLLPFQPLPVVKFLFQLFMRFSSLHSSSLGAALRRAVAVSFVLLLRPLTFLRESRKNGSWWGDVAGATKEEEENEPLTSPLLPPSSLSAHRPLPFPLSVGRSQAHPRRAIISGNGLGWAERGGKEEGVLGCGREVSARTVVMVEEGPLCRTIPTLSLGGETLSPSFFCFVLGLFSSLFRCLARAALLFSLCVCVCVCWVGRVLKYAG